MKTRIFFFLVALMSIPTSLSAQGVTEYYEPVVAEIVERGEKELMEYQVQNSVKSGNLFSRLYFDVFESSGMEFTLSLKDNDHMLKIESGFSLIISQAMRGTEKSELEASWQGLKENLDYAVVHYSSGEEGQTFWGRVLQSFLILVREGVEAMLVVSALIAYLKRSGYGDKVKVIWHGVGWALLASVGAAWVLNTAIKASGASREALEGIVMLVAALVLVYVSYWLTAKRDAGRWQAFIKGKMDAAMTRRSLFTLGFVAFLAVFREGAETILFYQALISGTSGELKAIWVGMGLAVVTLVVIYLLIRIVSLKMPLGLFFGGTAVFLFLMAFSFTGQGILELQVSGMIHTTKLEGWPMVSWIGVFPTGETVVAQLLLLALLPVGWFWLKRNEKRAIRATG